MCDEQQRRSHLPDMIKGDLDSLRDDVREYYRLISVQQRVLDDLDFFADANMVCCLLRSAQGTPIVPDHNQDYNDLHKCLAALVELDDNPETLQVVILGAFGGRFDQQMTAFQQMFVW